jgi:hypothetical protein
MVCDGDKKGEVDHSDDYGPGDACKHGAVTSPDRAATVPVPTTLLELDVSKSEKQSPSKRHHCRGDVIRRDMRELVDHLLRRAIRLAMSETHPWPRVL